MQSLQDLHARIQQKRKERRDLQSATNDELSNHARYQELVAQMKALREEKKAIENELREMAGNADQLNVLAVDIKSDMEMLADLCLNMYVKGESVQVLDQYSTRWVPMFSVRFIKDAEGVHEDPVDSTAN